MVVRRNCCSHINQSIDSELFVQNRDVPTRPVFDAPIRGSLSEYCHGVWYEKKLEWFGYVPTVKKFEDTITRFDRIHERDRRTERQRYRHRMTA